MSSALEFALSYGKAAPAAPAAQPSQPTSGIAAHLASGEGRITPEWLTKALTGGTLVGLVPGGQPIAAASAVGLGATEGLEAVRSWLQGNTSDAVMNGIVSALGFTGAGSVFRGLLRSGAKNPAVTKGVKELAKRAGTEGAKDTAAAAKAAQTASNAATKGKRFAPVAGEKAEARRALREARLAARNLTRAGKEVPEELAQDITTNARIMTEQGRKAALKQAAQTDPIIQGQRQLNKAVDTAMKMAKAGQPVKQLDASLTALMRRMGIGDDVIKSVREGLAKQAPNVRGRKAREAGEAGMAAAELLMRLTPAMAGAAVGGVAGANADIPEREQWEKIFMGTMAGAAAGFGLGSAGAALARGGGKELARTGLNWHQFSMLASHKTIIQANLGSVGAAVTKVADNILQGKFKQAAAGLKALQDAPKLYRAGFMNPQKHLPSHWTAQLNKKGVSLTSIPSRAIAAGDAVMSHVIQAMGGTKEEAIRMALSGTPRIPLLREAVNLVDDVVVGGKTRRAKFPLDKNPLAQLAARYFVPFVRPTAMALENAIEFSGAPVVMPKLAAMLGHQNANTGAAMAKFWDNESTRKAIIGAGGAQALGQLLASQTSPELDRWTAAAAGPNYLHARVGQHIRRRLDRGQDAGTIAQAAWGEVPLVAENISWNPLERMIPSGIRDIAKSIDPAFEREKGFASVSRDYLQRGGEYGSLGHTIAPLLGAAQARIPVLREELPERPMPVDVWGQPKFPDRPAFIPDVTLRGDVDIVLPKMLTATPMINPPDYPLDDELSQELVQLERENADVGPIMKPPMEPNISSLKELEALGGPEIPDIDRDLRLAGLDAKGSERRRMIEEFVQSPVFENLPDEQKIIFLRELVNSLGEGVGDLTEAALLAPERREEVITALRELAARYGER